MSTESPSKRELEQPEDISNKKAKTADEGDADVTNEEVNEEDLAEIDQANILPDTGRRTRGKKYDFKALNDAYDGPEGEEEDEEAAPAADESKDEDEGSEEEEEAAPEEEEDAKDE